MPRICLLDLCETPNGMAVFGRLPTGETATLFVANVEHTLYFAAAEHFDAGHIKDDLAKFIVQRLPSARCTRTLCPCRQCKRCSQDPCQCPCKGCGKAPHLCTCPCDKCDFGRHGGPPECYCRRLVAAVEINSEECASARLRDECPVLDVKEVRRRGLLGYEASTRRFIEVHLRHPQYAAVARKYFKDVNGGLPPHLGGTYESTASAVDAFMRKLDAWGFGWLEFEGDEVMGEKRSRSAREFHVQFSHVRAVQSPDMAPPMTRMTLDCETLVKDVSKFTHNEYVPYYPAR